MFKVSMFKKFSAPAAILSALALSACAGTTDVSQSADTGMSYTDRGWAYTDVVGQDWPKAESKLASEVAEHPEDPFRLLNLAYVYTQTDRPADAAATYEKVLSLNENPMATLYSGEDVRTKKIARDALASLGLIDQ